VERLQGQKSAEAIEYFDRDVLALMQREQENGVVLREHVPVPEDRCAVYVEYAGASREDMPGQFSFVRECIADLGADPSETWLAAGSTDLEKLKEFRHAAPLCVNHVIAETKKTYSTITKLGTDMSVPTGCLRQVFRMYRSGLRSFRAAVFGHIGDNHIHVNIMPRNPEEYASAKALYTEWARWVSAMGGSVSAEHGIGKLKRWLLAEMYTREHLEGMRALKRVFDPRELLGRGNMFDTKEPLVDEGGEME
jgi:D-lactate dehydrogenase (cytochrome)